jgi:hypothetical protein
MVLNATFIFAHNSSRKVYVIYDKTSQVTGQDDNHFYCISASESNGYKWQANINNDDDKTRFDISWIR